MGKRLTENITSRYIQAANNLRAKTARKRIVAYVESYDDVSFWSHILSRFDNDTTYFQVLLPSSDVLLLLRTFRGEDALFRRCRRYDIQLRKTVSEAR